MSMSFGASYKDNEKGTRNEKILNAFQDMRNGKGKAKGAETIAKLASEGW